MKIVLAGGSSFIGRPLVKTLLDAGHEVILLTRWPTTVDLGSSDLLQIEGWDGQTLSAWTRQLDGADAVINLAGEPIAAKRWTRAQKARIKESRINTTKNIVDAIGTAEERPTVLINASAVGYYGNVEKGEVTEEHPPGSGFLAETCVHWESETQNAVYLGLRVVRLRMGVVLGEGGGALQKMILPFNIFMGGPLGSGKQWFPWVHRDDVVGVILYALENAHLHGPLNVTAPEPVTMKQFCQRLGQVMHRPSWASVPAFVLRLFLGEMSEMLLTGQKAVPKKLKEAGYSFKYPKLAEALKSIL